jgi:hypothetical protein
VPLVRFHVDPCPCGSGRIVKDCCLKPIGSLRPTQSASACFHNKCYAQEFANCSSKISGEHWISAGVLETLARFGPLNVGGLPWHPPGTTKEMSVDSLQSNILCERHNSALSPLDQVAIRFFGAFPHIKGKHFGTSALTLFCGGDLERWMLKVLCGGISSGVVRPSSGRPVGWRPPTAWLDFLFAGTSIPSPMGLYLTQTEGDWVDASRGVGIACLATGAEIYGLLIELHGFRFILAMVPPASPLPPDSLLTHASFRPSSFVFGNGADDVLLLDWGPSHQGAEFRMNWTTAGPPPAVQPSDRLAWPATGHGPDTPRTM